MRLRGTTSAPAMPHPSGLDGVIRRARFVFWLEPGGWLYDRTGTIQGCIRSDPVQLPRALLFDMDGTITRPVLDFDKIRAEIGITGPILEAIERLDEPDRQRAFKILDQHEISAANSSTLNDGCHDLMKLTTRMGLRTALITRNSRANVEIVLKLHDLRFDAIFTRDNSPPKPDPAALINACRFFSLPIESCWMVGDGLHDIDATLACGMKCVWVQHNPEETPRNQPWLTIRSLKELTNLLTSLHSMKLV